MTIEEAFRLVANLDVEKESHRRYAPQFGLLLYNKYGQVEAVYRFKEDPSDEEKVECMKRHPDCIQISTAPDWYPTPEELQKRINKGLWLFAHMKDDK